jgi:hypothetical protein
MIRRAVIFAVGVAWLAGCGDSVERRQLAEPGTGGHPGSAAAGVAADLTSPHGEMAGAASRESNPREVYLEGMQLTAPSSWIRKPPRAEFILAEFALPHAQGDAADARLTVSSAGGTVAENIARWRQQFGDKPQKESQTEMAVAGTEVTLVDFSGKYLDQRGPFTPATECPDYRMLGAIIEMGGRLNFIKCTGPANTVAARADEFRAFVRSLKSAAAAK